MSQIDIKRLEELAVYQYGEQCEAALRELLAIRRAALDMPCVESWLAGNGCQNDEGMCEIIEGRDAVWAARLVAKDEEYRAAANESVALHAQVAKQQEEITRLREALDGLAEEYTGCDYDDTPQRSCSNPNRRCARCSARTALAGGAK